MKGNNFVSNIITFENKSTFTLLNIPKNMTEKYRVPTGDYTFQSYSLEMFKRFVFNN